MCGTKNSGLSRRQWQEQRKITTVASMSIRKKKKPRLRLWRKLNTQGMKQCQSKPEPKPRSPKKSESNSKPADFSLKRVGCNWKPVANSLKQQAARVQARLPE